HIADAFEMNAFDHAAVPHVQAGYDAFGDHMPSADASASFRSSAPLSSALPATAPWRPIAASARISARADTPPEAMTSRPLIPSVSRYACRLGPAIMPSRAMSVYTAVVTPMPGRRARRSRARMAVTSFQPWIAT